MEVRFLEDVEFKNGDIAFTNSIYPAKDWGEDYLAVKLGQGEWALAPKEEIGETFEIMDQSEEEKNMRFFEFKNPFYALIKAENEKLALEVYKEVVDDYEMDYFERGIEEVSKYDALRHYLDVCMRDDSNALIQDAIARFDSCKGVLLLSGDLQCKTCERRSNIGCQVFKKKPSNCWAYTTDKDWLRKVKSDVEKYRNRETIG